jgi:hypothetical protein
MSSRHRLTVLVAAHVVMRLPNKAGHHSGHQYSEAASPQKATRRRPVRRHILSGTAVAITVTVLSAADVRDLLLRQDQ